MAVAKYEVTGPSKRWRVKLLSLSWFLLNSGIETLVKGTKHGNLEWIFTDVSSQIFLAMLTCNVTENRVPPALLWSSSKSN